MSIADMIPEGRAKRREEREGKERG